MNNPEINIEGIKIGLGNPCYVIAEIGVNHNGSLEVAQQLVHLAAQAGANSVKFQVFDPESIAAADAPVADYQAATGATTQRELLESLTLTEEELRQLKAQCFREKIAFLATPFDLPSLALLDRMNVSAYKVGSGDLTNSPLLRAIAEKSRPMIVSTGMSTLGEIETAIAAIEAMDNHYYALLHCVSLYPTPINLANLRAIDTLSRVFGKVTGFSDHTQSAVVVPTAAVTLGASIIEKHLTLDRTMEGPDHAASLNPEEFARMVAAIRDVEQALGSGRKLPAVEELETAQVARKSLVAKQTIKAGMVITEDMVDFQRPGTGISPGALV